jgi:nucleosome binding factor SPN SPT16 subunit
MGDDVKVDVGTFGTRLQKLYKHWFDQRDTAWGGSRALAVAVGSSTEDLRYLKSLTLHLWLFGYELPGACVVVAMSLWRAATQRLL